MAGLPTIAVESIHPHPDNPRGALGDLTELAASIRAVGLLQPLVVTQVRGGFVVLDGHRRLAAAKLAGAQALPCIAVRPGTVEHEVAVMLAAAMHRQLDPVEQGRSFQRLRDSGLTVTEIARRAGYSPSTISGRLLLAKLPDEVQDMVAEKTLSVTEATGLARQVQRDTAGTAAPIVAKAVWLTPRHRLAAAVAQACDHRPTRRLIGGVGCGQCWEHAIRADALTPPEESRS